MTQYKPAGFTTTAPQHVRAEWSDDGRTLLNKGTDKALWSGKGDVPAVGAYVDIKGDVATVLGYFVDCGWLMLWCERHSDGKHGDLAGIEIAQ